MDVGFKEGSFVTPPPPPPSHLGERWREEGGGLHRRGARPRRIRVPTTVQTPEPGSHSQRLDDRGERG